MPQPLPPKKRPPVIPTVKEAVADFTSSWSDPPPSDADKDPLIGLTLSKTYRITRVIGEGGMGRVYEAWHTRITKKRYAIKVLHSEFARETEVLVRFKREAEASACVSHPNVVGVYDVALTPQGWPYLVCEFLEGIELAAHLKASAPLKPREAVNIAIQISDALIAAHETGVIHRDLKPQNVFLLDPKFGTRDGSALVKVLDFGLSRFIDSSDTQLTKTGMVMGTPAYMAPEQARGERADHRADVYGLGSLLYTAVTGRPPFSEETPQATLFAVMNRQPPRPHALNPTVPIHLELIIQRAIARSPSDRYPDMQAMRKALAGLDYASDSRRGADAAMSPGRPRLPSVMEVDAEGARTKLIGWSSVGALALCCATMIAIHDTVVMVRGQWPLTRIESVLAVAVVFGTLLTPAWLLFRHVRRNVWRNTARVVDWMQRIRKPVLGALLTLGLLQLVVRFLDSVVAKLAVTRLAGPPSGIAWPGWSVLFLVLSVGAGAALWFQQRLSSGKRPSASLGIATRLLWAIFAATTLACLAVGLKWRAATSPGASETLAQDESPASGYQSPQATTPTIPDTQANGVAAHQAEAGDVAGSATSEARAPKKEAPEAPRASHSRLSLARSAGKDALEALATEYPEDPEVLHALALSYAASSATLTQAMQTLKKTLSLEPSKATARDIRIIVKRTTRITGKPRALAFDLMREDMGTTGADLLYSLAISQPAVKDVALTHLKQAIAKGAASPALEVAYALRFETSCKGRLKLLPEATEHGDSRSVAVLAALSRKTRRGCGSKKRSPCSAKCPAQAQRFNETIEAINARTPD